jgi:AcrR family transcriptional regulator
MPAPAPGRREAILAAAQQQFARYGFRRTSMEDIAREAGVSRPALYLHFRNKEEIFRSLSASLQEAALAAAEAELKAPGSLQRRVHAALEVKVVRMLEIVHDSPHGAELLDASSRLCGDLAARSEVRLQRMLEEVFRDAARSGEIDLRGAGLSAAAAAELIRLAAYGLKVPGGDPADFRRRLARLVRVFFAGLGGGRS